MRIEDLEYHAPETLADAGRLLHSLGGDARILAGGTDLLADLKQGRLRVNNLVSLARIPELKILEWNDQGLWIGPLLTPNQLAESEVVLEHLPGLSDAAASMAGMQIRNLATIGGNLCSAVPSADLPPSLLTAEAELHLVSHGEERKVPVKEFFLGPRKTALRQGEILQSIFVSPFGGLTGTAYEKYQLRGASALAVVGAAARVTLKNNRIEKACVAIGAAAPVPFMIEAAGAFLEGKEPLDEYFVKAGDLAEKEVKPITDLRGSDTYRRDLARVLTIRALRKALERI